MLFIMSCCNNNTYETTINNTPVVLTEVSSGCYVSRFPSPNTKVGVRKKRLSSSCCEQINLSKISRNFEWYDGICSGGTITYDTIQITTRSEQILIDVSLNITPQELVNLLSDHSLTLKRAVELINTRVSTEDLNCEAEYCNEELSVPVSPICPPGTTATSGTITVPACQFVSNISISDANQQALSYIALIKQDFISNNLSCTDIATYCNEEVSSSAIKPNCVSPKVGLSVPTTIEAGTLCGYATQEIANIAAQQLLDATVNSNAASADPTVYCGDNYLIGSTSGCPSVGIYSSRYGRYAGDDSVVETGTVIEYPLSAFYDELDFTDGDLIKISVIFSNSTEVHTMTQTLSYFTGGVGGVGSCVPYNVNLNTRPNTGSLIFQDYIFPGMSVQQEKVYIGMVLINLRNNVRTHVASGTRTTEQSAAITAMFNS